MLNQHPATRSIFNINASSFKTHCLVLALQLIGLWVVLTLPGCGNLFDPSSVSIASIQPGKTPIDQKVSIRGRVVRKIPLPDTFVYELQDETGSILVLTSEPDWSIGSEVTVQGRLQLENMMVGNAPQREIYLDMTEP